MHNKKVCFALLFLWALGSHFVAAQQDAQYTQYMFNTMSVNPAYAGSRGQLSIAALYRSQWAGLEGAPKTQTLNLHSPIRNSKLGYGVSIVNDNIGDGTVQETYLDGVISYTLDVGFEKKLSFGLKAGGSLLSLDFSKLQGFENEPISQQNIDNKFSPNVGLGVYYHTNVAYFGVSVPNLLQTEHFDNSSADTSGSTFLVKERLNFYVIGGYVFELNPNLKFKPSFLTKAVSGAPIQVDLSANFLLNDRFYLGAAYRWDAAVSGLFGFQISDQIMLGLAYDRETTELGATQFNDGSFEVFLRFELVKAFRGLVSPRFF
ncbi:PorP/SprF family type IX secretion system membrane protein [Sediminicola luteus]|uniref:Type IX secretion system membrane protein PorP/SprF n=1 Tax=Sediminicola luteus TaxID=319238 RepID=A0A2A4G6B7_9FLAO|nr:type IX secretion system membrane protein PorP/SprF [Sediminicola luteus]PCE63526.1 hypothetical protein B7P33_15095 [Sediminicola luteus]